MRFRENILENIAVCVLLFALCGCAKSNLSGDPEKVDGVSANLGCTLAFDASSYEFTVQIKNVTPGPVKVKVVRERFEGEIDIVFTDGHTNAFLAGDFLMTMGTGMRDWDHPESTLHRGEALTWKVPLTQLASLNSKYLFWEPWQGSQAKAVLKDVTLVPSRGGWVYENAGQVSNPILLTTPK